MISNSLFFVHLKKIHFEEKPFDYEAATIKYKMLNFFHHSLDTENHHQRGRTPA